MRTSADAASELPVALKKAEDYRKQVRRDTYIKQSTFSVNSHKSNDKSPMHTLQQNSFSGSPK